MMHGALSPACGRVPRLPWATIDLIPASPSSSPGSTPTPHCSLQDSGRWRRDGHSWVSAAVCVSEGEANARSIYKEIGPGRRVALSKLAVEKFEETGRPLRIAIDTSIWLFQIQASKGMLATRLRTLQ